MSEYMRKLKEDIGYISLKEKHNREMAKIFNKFESDGMTTPADRDKQVAENQNDIVEEEEKTAKDTSKENSNSNDKATGNKTDTKDKPDVPSKDPPNPKESETNTKDEKKDNSNVRAKETFDEKES